MNLKENWQQILFDFHHQSESRCSIFKQLLLYCFWFYGIKKSVKNCIGQDILIILSKVFK